MEGFPGSWKLGGLSAHSVPERVRQSATTYRKNFPEDSHVGHWASPGVFMTQ